MIVVWWCAALNDIMWVNERFCWVVICDVKRPQMPHLSWYPSGIWHSGDLPHKSNQLSLITLLILNFLLIYLSLLPVESRLFRLNKEQNTALKKIANILDEETNWINHCIYCCPCRND
jgi:hypothetical protein